MFGIFRDTLCNVSLQTSKAGSAAVAAGPRRLRALLDRLVRHDGELGAVAHNGALLRRLDADVTAPHLPAGHDGTRLRMPGCAVATGRGRRSGLAVPRGA